MGPSPGFIAEPALPAWAKTDETTENGEVRRLCASITHEKEALRSIASIRTGYLFSISRLFIDLATTEFERQHQVMKQSTMKKRVDRTSRHCAFSAAPGSTATLDYAFGALSFREGGGAT
jgi:hypothetical protein